MTRLTRLKASFLTATALSIMAFTTLILRVEAQGPAPSPRQPVLDTVVVTMLKALER